jgi:hypothetical protein
MSEDNKVFTMKTKDVGLMSVIPHKDGSATVRHEASGQSQRHANFHEAVKMVREGGPQ